MSADVMITKTEALGWKSTRSIKEYIDALKKNRWH